MVGFFGGGFFFVCVGGLVVLGGFVLGLWATRGARRQCVGVLLLIWQGALSPHCSHLRVGRRDCFSRHHCFY